MNPSESSINVISVGRSHLEFLAKLLLKKRYLRYFFSMWPKSKLNLPNEKIISAPLALLPYLITQKTFGYTKFSNYLSDLIFLSYFNFHKKRLSNIESSILDINFSHLINSKIIDAPSCLPEHQLKVWSKEQKYTNCSIGRLNAANYLIQKRNKKSLEMKKKIYICPSKAAAKTFQDYGYNSKVVSFPLQKININSNKIPQNEKEKRDHKKTITIGFIGIVCPSKGIHKALEAISKANNSKRIKVKLIGMVQNPAFKKYLLCNFQNLDITFTGHLRNKILINEMLSLDLVLMSSPSEGLPLSCINAINYEIPIIFTEQSGLSTFLENVGEYDYFNMDELINLIETFSSSELLKSQKKLISKNYISQTNYLNSYIESIKSFL